MAHVTERLAPAPLSAILAWRGRRPELAAGRAVPIVLVHGIFDSAACWFPVMDALIETGRPVLAIDLLGHGLSPRVGDDFTLTRHADLVRETLGSHGIERADLVGHSLGGLVAQQLAQTHPEVVASLTIEDPAWGVAQDPHRLPDAQRARIEQLATWPPSQVLAVGRNAHPLWDERDTTGWFEAKMDVDLGLHDARQDWVARTGPDSWDVYPGPVLLISAECERGALVTPEMVGQASAALGDRLTHRHVDGVGHDIRKDGKESYLAALLPFLARDERGE